MENKYLELEYLSTHLQPVERQEDFLYQLKNLFDEGVIHNCAHYNLSSATDKRKDLYVIIHDSNSLSDFINNFASANKFTDIYCYYLDAPTEDYFSHTPVPKLPFTLTTENVLLISKSKVAASWFERVVVLGFTKSGKIAPRYISVQPSKQFGTEFGTLYEYKGKADSRKFILY